MTVDNIVAGQSGLTALTNLNLIINSVNGFTDNSGLLSINSATSIFSAIGDTTGSTSFGTVRGIYASGLADSSIGAYITGYPSTTADNTYGAFITGGTASVLTVVNGSNQRANIATTLDLRRNTGFGSLNVTGDIIKITDNPTTSGTISGKILTATIGTTERVSLNPRVADGATAVAYFEDTHNNLTTAGAKIHSFRNQGVEKALIDKDGSIEGGGANFKITAEGGYAIKLTAGEDLYKGEIVYLPIGGAANSTVLKAPTSSEMPIGVVYADALNTASVWIVVAGMTDVLPMTSVTAARGNVIFVSATEAGRVNQSASTPTTEHWGECGHFLNTGSGAGVLARAVIHFN